jgi:hypothetical protein
MFKVILGIALGALVVLAYYNPAESKSYARSALHATSSAVADGAKAADQKLAEGSKTAKK